MSTEICKLCGLLCTPWHYVHSLVGHICHDCMEVNPNERLSVIVKRIENLESRNQKGKLIMEFEDLAERIARLERKGNSMKSSYRHFESITREEFEDAKYWGLLVTVDIKNCDPLMIRDADAIKHYVSELCKLIEMKPFGETQVVNFGEDERVAGFSMVQLIETSLISGHFANLTNNAYIDVFSCKWFEPLSVADFTKEYFKGGKANGSILVRE